MHITEIEKVINSEGLEREIRLSGKIRIGENKSSSFTIGKTCDKRGGKYCAGERHSRWKRSGDRRGIGR